MHPPSNFEYFNRPLNMDISNKCRLRCPSCDRYKPYGKEMIRRSRDLSLEDYDKVITAFRNVAMCGQISDPIYHPQLLEMIKMSGSLNHMQISTNGSNKTDEWWQDAFTSSIDNNNTTWVFALDGLPNESHKYRINQDGEAVWEVMKVGKQMGANIRWQYIPFKYNEDHIDQAKEMASDVGIELMVKVSSRHPDGFRPSNPDLVFDKPDVKVISTDTIEPQCVKYKEPTLNAEGYFMPCCWTDSLTDTNKEQFAGFLDPSLNISNIDDIVTEIFHSDVWVDFFSKIQDNNQEAPYVCKKNCGQQGANRKFKQ